jgi:hypothetical protein
MMTVARESGSPAAETRSQKPRRRSSSATPASPAFVTQAAIAAIRLSSILSCFRLKTPRTMQVAARVVESGRRAVIARLRDAAALV